MGRIAFSLQKFVRGFFFVFVGFLLLQLDVGSQFPDQGLNPDSSGESTKA